MKRVAMFNKVSFDQFKNSVEDNFGVYKYSDEELRDMYDGLNLPKRATEGSAGHDFYLPMDIHIEPHRDIVIPTGINCKMNEGWVLFIVPRSSIGIKYNISMSNTIAVIDEDFINGESEGNILIKLKNNGNKDFYLNRGDRFCQGILVEYGITDFDYVNDKRTGGVGSTNA